MRVTVVVCVRPVSVHIVFHGFGGGEGRGDGGEGGTSQVLLSWSVGNMGTAGLRKALADLPCRWKLAGGLELCCDQWWLLHNPCGPRPAVLPVLNAGSGASKQSQAALVVEVRNGFMGHIIIPA